MNADSTAVNTIVPQTTRYHHGGYLRLLFNILMGVVSGDELICLGASNIQWRLSVEDTIPLWKWRSCFQRARYKLSPVKLFFR